MTDDRYAKYKMFSRRLFLTLRLQDLWPDASTPAIQEAVASTAIAHPEWKMNELRTWAEWEREYKHDRGTSTT